MILALVETLRLSDSVLPRSDEGELARELYELLHLRRSSTARPSSNGHPAFKARHLFGPQMRPETGWRRVRRTEFAHPIFEKGGLHVAVEPENILVDGSISLPAIRDRYTPGFAALLSPVAPGSDGVRIYVAVGSAAAPDAGRALAVAVKQVAEKFVIKGLTPRMEYPRPDAFTVYVSRRDRRAVLGAIGSAFVGGLLDQSIPGSLFARYDRSGVGWIEGPPDSSAGEVRARCVARAFIARGRQSDCMLGRAIEHEFEKAGIDPGNPYRLLKDGVHAG